MTNFEIICPSCGETEFSVSNEEDRFVYGCDENAVELSASVPVHACENCGFQFTSGDAEDIRHEAICRHLGRMPPRKIKELRKANNLTRAEFADITGIGSASLSRWETGQLVQGAAHDNLLYLLLTKPNLERLAGRVPEPEYEIQSDDVQVFEQDSTFIYIKTPTTEMTQRMTHFSLHRH